MELYEREFFVYRLLANYQRFNLGSKVLKIMNPTPEIMYEAQEIYVETLNSARENGVSTEEDIDKLLRDRNLWSDEDEDQLVNVLPKHVEFWKVEIFKNFVNVKERKRLELHLEAARNGLNQLYQRKHVFDHFSQHGLATFARWQRIAEACTVNYDGTSYDWSDININHVLDYISKTAISEAQIREVVRNDPWRSIWSAGKRTRNLFGKPVSELTDDQRRAINWSGQYDNIQEFPDRPPEPVFNHDDAFDGWMILKNKEIEKARNEEDLKRRTGNGSMDAPEVFMIKGEHDDPDKFRETVYGMNDPTSRFIVNSRLGTINALGTATDSQFADVQREVTRGVGNIVKGR